MKYLSVCSGIEAASVAWEPLDWRPEAFAEVARFPAAVLARHWPAVPNLGDLSGIKGEDFRGLVDLIVGGTPCQSFSVAGLREGLDDPRGDLTLKFFKLARRVRARWLVWENVPGILSHDGGRTFGAVLGAMAECGYGFAYRVLDAQYFGVPQRRRRVFLVGYLGDWRCAAAVLFERHCLRRHPAPRRRATQKLAGTLAASTFTGGPGGRPESGAGNHFVVHPLNGHGRRMECESETFIVAHALRGEGFDASEDGTGRQNLVVAFHGAQDPDVSGSVTHPLGRNHGLEACVSMAPGMRRLTPRECERLIFRGDAPRIPDRLLSRLRMILIFESTTAALSAAEIDRLQAGNAGQS